MKKTAEIVIGLLAACVVLVLLLDAFAGMFQPSLSPGKTEGVLHSFDANGTRHDTRLAVADDVAGNVWLQSGHHFRGWYHRVLENPSVELTRGSETRAYTAVPVDTPEAEALVRELFTELAGGPVQFALIRTFLLFADIKPIRLDPRLDPH